jgi:hypothetical protein
MKSGKTSLYLSDRLANLLDAHGPTGNEGERNLGEKLGYIVTGWDRILRDEKNRWGLTREEWFVCQSCTVSHSFSMENGGPVDIDVGAVLACVEDTLDSEIMLDDAPKWRDSTIQKLRGASVAAQLALVWMLIRERNRIS